MTIELITLHCTFTLFEITLKSFNPCRLVLTTITGLPLILILIIFEHFCTISLLKWLHILKKKSNCIVSLSLCAVVMTLNETRLHKIRDRTSPIRFYFKYGTVVNIFNIDALGWPFLHEKISLSKSLGPRPENNSVLLT